MRVLQRLAVVVAAGFAAVGSQQASAQSDYPNRPVRLVVGFTPGSVADITGRVLGNRMGQILGQQFVIENKPGAASNLAAEFVARAPKDGYTLFLPGSVNANNAAMLPNLSFDIARDFAPVALINEVAVILVVHPSVGVNSVKELIALAKSKPGELTYASTGIGSAPHMSGELFMQNTGTKLVHVPYQGSPQAATDLLAGRVQVMFSPATAVISLVKSGQLKVLASSTAKRASVLPDVPTMIEAGMPGFVTSIWFGLSAPAGTPAEAVGKLSRAAQEAVKSPDVIAAWGPQGVDPMPGGPEDYARFLASELKRWGDVVVAAGLKK
jgi:tripartite-type tricarboxylate transporter receptor subunit TctC